MRVLGIAAMGVFLMLALGCANEGIPPAKPQVFKSEVDTGTEKNTVQQRVQTPKASIPSGPIEGLPAASVATGISLSMAPSESLVSDASNVVPTPEVVPDATVNVAEKDPAAAALPLPAATAGPQNGVVGLMLLIAAAAWLTFGVLYRRSRSSRMNRRMGEMIASFEATTQGQKDLLEKMELAIKASATGYLNEVRRGYLLATSIDEVRRLAPGVRLKPLHEHGMTTLLAVQGWNVSRFIQLRGIGPDSARQIAAACAALTKAALSQPVAHPRVTDNSSNGQQLFRQIYAFGQAREKLAGQFDALTAILGEWRPRCKAVENQTTFSRWLIGSETKGPLQVALAEGAAIEKKLEREGELGRALEDGRSRLADAIRISQQPVAVQTVVEDVKRNAELYRALLIKYLGTDVHRPSEAVQRAEEKVEPAHEPIRLRMPAEAGTTPRFSISISVGDSAPSETPADSAVRATESWVPAGRRTTVGRLEVPGGMIYVGKRLRSVNGSTVEPALIDPAQPVSVGEADCHVRMLNYWSSYSYASPEARASYLQWLSTGRKDPAADIGYVFLYFYGLERRVLAEAKVDPVSRAEIPAIIEEVRRLRSIYGQSGSFNRYSGEFLDFVEATQSMDVAGSDDEEPPPLIRYQLTFGLRRKLGELAKARKPLPANWAYAWYHNDLRTRLPAAAERCPEYMARLFTLEYERELGLGLVLPANKTRLKVTYRPASSSFGSSLAQSVDLPDVSVLTTSYATLDGIAVKCFQQLDAYSRFVGRNQAEKDSFAGIALLPVRLWPANWQAVTTELAKSTAGVDAMVMTLAELLGRFGQQTALPRLVYVGWCRSLASAGIGLEPDPRFGGEVPELEDTVAVFPSDGTEHVSEGFGLAALLLRLSAAVAAADGEFSDAEMQLLRKEIDGNSSLQEEDKRRLLARQMRFRLEAPGLTGLKSTIQQLNAEARVKVTDFLLSLIYTDRTVAPGEVKVMEKIYSLFGLEANALYTRLHEVSAGTGTKSAPVLAGQASGPLQLNAAKIQQLRAASDEVTKRLAEIFDAEHAAMVEAEKKETAEPEPAALNASTLLGLDAAHADLLTLLLTRTQWTRAEFEEVCGDKGLMPDGAMERINDAAFAKFDQPIIEGDDPLEVAVQLLEETEYASDHQTA